MTGERTAKKDRDPIFTICLAIFVIAAIIAVGTYINNEFVATEDGGKVSTGDTVSVNYTGTYYDEFGNEYAVVFDTSYSSIANDDDIAKSNDFTKKDSYSALSFVVGKGTMLEDFENSVIGKSVGDKYKIKIDAAHGYVGAITTDVLNVEGNSMLISKTVTYDDFHSVYSDVDIKDKTGMIKFESKYKWDAYAMLTDNGKSVIITYAPAVGEYTVYEFGDTKVIFEVTEVNDSLVIYNIDIQNPTILNNDGDIQMIKLDLGKEPIYITNITSDVITYKQGTNAERVNQDLYFEIEIVSVS